MIPKILHLCFGLSPDFGNMPWSLMNHVCTMSAVERLKPDRVRFYYEFEPSGPWWAQTKPYVECVKVTAPREVFGNPLLHPAHRADVLRLQVLIEQGGIYLDTDVMVHRDFDDLLANAVVMGREGPDWPRLCNAVILARRDTSFLKRWYEQYRSFRGSSGAEYWAEHSVRLPFRLMQQHPDEITVLPHDAFHWPGPTNEEVALMFGAWPGRDVRSRYANHLWAQLSLRYTWDLTPGQVRRVDSAFHRWARPFVADLPDDYGKPRLLFRVRRRLKHVRKKLVRQLGL
jgi:hypothetical protein